MARKSSHFALLRLVSAVRTRVQSLERMSLIYIYIDPNQIVADSITNNQPIVFVSINYRLNIFSFGDGKEKNLALKDQRLGIDWVRRNIASFGGGPVSFP